MRKTKLDRDIPVPLHYQIRKNLENQIRKGTLPVGGMLPPERELMTMYKVSRATVRQALDDLANLGLIQRGAGKGTFVTGKGQAKDLFFTLILPSQRMVSPAANLYYFIYYDLIKGVSEACRTHAVKMQILYVANDPESCKQGQIELKKLENLNGVMFLGSGGYESLYKYVIDCGIPRVLLTMEEDPPDTARIRADSYTGACDLMEHFLSLGHRRIGLIYHRRSTLIRYQAYYDVLKKHGIPADPQLTEAIELEKNEPVGASLTSLRQPPTAIFASNDIIAMRLIDQLHAKGIRVPEDVSVAGFDDMPGVENFTPPLTTVKIDSEKIGYEAVKLLKRWNEDAAYTPSLHLLKTDLVIRKSCAPLA